MKNTPPPLKTILLVWVCFVAIFGFIFYRLFTEYALPGQYDSWFHLALFQEWGNAIRAFVTSTPTGYSMFPEKGLFKYGEPSPMSALVYLFIKLIVADPVYSFGVFTVLFCSLNGLGFYLFSRNYSANHLACFGGAILFSCSNFLFGNIDHQNVYFWGNALFALTVLKLFLQTASRKWWWLFIAFDVVQIYFSSTVFIYLNFASGLLVLMNCKTVLSSKKNLWAILFGGGFLFLGILPFAETFLFSGIFKSTFNQASGSLAPYIANIHPIDLLRVVPGNLIYPTLTDIDFPVQYLIRSAFVGLSLYFLIGFVLIKRIKVPMELVVVLIAGLVLAGGGGYYFKEHLIPMPMKLFYDLVGSDSILRTPSRGFVLVILSLSTIAVLGLEEILSYPKGKLFLGLILLVFLLENVPFQKQLFAAKAYVNSNQNYVATIPKRKDKITAVHLPSKIMRTLPDSRHFPDEITREFMYSYWAALKGYNCLNGVNGITAWSRMKNDSLMRTIDEKQHLEQLIANNKLDLLIWHKDLLCKNETDWTKFLNSNPNLTLIQSDSITSIYRITVQP